MLDKTSVKSSLITWTLVLLKITSTRNSRKSVVKSMESRSTRSDRHRNLKEQLLSLFLMQITRKKLEKNSMVKSLSRMSLESSPIWTSTSKISKQTSTLGTSMAQSQFPNLKKFSLSTVTSPQLTSSSMIRVNLLGMVTSNLKRRKMLTNYLTRSKSNQSFLIIKPLI